jgi:hypothetical protein
MLVQCGCPVIPTQLEAEQRTSIVRPIFPQRSAARFPSWFLVRRCSRRPRAADRHPGPHILLLRGSEPRSDYSVVAQKSYRGMEIRPWPTLSPSRSVCVPHAPSVRPVGDRSSDRSSALKLNVCCEGKRLGDFARARNQAAVGCAGSTNRVGPEQAWDRETGIVKGASSCIAKCCGRLV